MAGCGGGGNATAATAPPTTTSGSRRRSACEQGGLGKILVDSQGRTLYLFQKDTGTKSACSGACASAWPPLRATGKPTVGSGARASMVGTTTAVRRKPQVTYNGHPLYLYSGDQSAGDTNGQGLTASAANWYVLSPAGSTITTSSGSGGSSSGY